MSWEWGEEGKRNNAMMKDMVDIFAGADAVAVAGSAVAADICDSWESSTWPVFDDPDCDWDPVSGNASRKG